MSTKPSFVDGSLQHVAADLLSRRDAMRRGLVGWSFHDAHAVLVGETLERQLDGWSGRMPCAGCGLHRWSSDAILTPMKLPGGVFLPSVRTSFRSLTCLLLAGALIAGCSTRPTLQTSAVPKPADLGRGQGSLQTCVAHRLPAGQIVLDGRANEPAWTQAAVERRFIFPWKQAPAPATEFRALWDDANFYFTFRAQDADIFVLDRLRDEQDAVFEDRVEIYLCRDERMKNYFCFEVDSRGRAFDYRAQFYRRFDSSWNFPGLETKASPLPDGYEVEGRIPLKSLVALGFPAARPGVRIRCGLYRAEFSHDRSGRPIAQRESLHNLGRQIEGPPPLEEWMSWVDPKTKEPDFHVPASLGWLEFTR